MQKPFPGRQWRESTSERPDRYVYMIILCSAITVLQLKIFLLLHNYTIFSAVNDHKYEHIGMVMAYGVVHLGIVPQFFSPKAVDVLKAGSTRGIKCEIEDVTDGDVREIIDCKINNFL